MKNCNDFLTIYAFVATGVASLLLLFVAFSASMIGFIDFFRIIVAGGGGGGSDGVLNFGVWGYCNSGIGASSCSPPRLGWQLDSSTANDFKVNDLPGILTNAATDVFGINLGPFVLAVTSFGMTLIAYSRRKRSGGTALEYTPGTKWAVFVAAGFSMLVTLCFDGPVIAVITGKLVGLSGNVRLYWGSGIWLALAAGILLCTVVPITGLPFSCHHSESEG